MRLVVPLGRTGPGDLRLVGGKALALAEMARRSLLVPEALCVTTEAYRRYVEADRLQERVDLEIHRKPFEEMRWEEIWDLSLRIRNLFLNTPIPRSLAESLRGPLEETFRDRAVAVRSSAPAEDSSKASFAGLHESYLNVHGTEAVLEHVRLVWASLWSDAALLYRKELGLTVEKSAMAVLVQEMVFGERSGVAFGRNPNDESQAVVEAVYGLNQGMVDGTVEPDRWILDRERGKILRHTPAVREKAVRPAAEGVLLEALDVARKKTPPLNEARVGSVWNLLRRAEAVFGSPQDLEWTFRGETLYALQSRPITAAKTGEDERGWYLSLRRSYENLKGLRKKIEGEILPGMEREAERLAAKDPASLSDRALADEIEMRAEIDNRWKEVYWSDCIPFAHGARLFGRFYNDTVSPKDPYEFVSLLTGTEMEGLRRNRAMGGLAARLRKGEIGFEDDSFAKEVEALSERIGPLFGSTEGLRALIREMAANPGGTERPPRGDVERLKGDFLSRFRGEKRALAEGLLDLARASYRLRDDDNVSLGRIEAQLERFAREGGRRLNRQGRPLKAAEVAKALRDPAHVPREEAGPKKKGDDPSFRARQIVGQPASPGLAQGRARVIRSPDDLSGFKAGEVLVCDAIDPRMTFVVPLAAGIVERRGGMLIHGAIIAREYGIPCVTGVPDAADLIRTGDRVTVDGAFGLVVIGRGEGDDTRQT